MIKIIRRFAVRNGSPFARNAINAGFGFANSEDRLTVGAAYNFFFGIALYFDVGANRSLNISGNFSAVANGLLGDDFAEFVDGKNATSLNVGNLPD